MWKTNYLILVVVTFSVVNIYSQKSAQKAQLPVFSSVYSDISHGRTCRTIEMEIIRCKPVGGYQLFATFHNVIEDISIETVTGQEVVRISPYEHSQISRNIGKFEWRLANGKPFAIIARFVLFSMEDVEADRDLTSDYSKFEKWMVVKGLTGFEQINFDFDTKSIPNSNQKARDLADANYRKHQ